MKFEIERPFLPKKESICGVRGRWEKGYCQWALYDDLCARPCGSIPLRISALHRAYLQLEGTACEWGMQHRKEILN